MLKFVLFAMIGEKLDMGKGYWTVLIIYVFLKVVAMSIYYQKSDSVHRALKKHGSKR